MSEREKIFVDGLIVKSAKPDFIIAKLSVKVEEFTEWTKKNQVDGWVNIDLKESKSGKFYGELNDWKPNKEGGRKSTEIDTSDNLEDEDFPF